ncbi:MULTISPECIES: NAD(P)/FAD-dependent oxidoreductase [Sphingomonadaceae]|uniref:AntAa n=1 Tax=Sphingomonas sp. XLDN2-5 TaxID=411925 RepID=D5IGH3_9SPHN|nr:MULTISPECIES: FAD-dependent oxidoreductase [Sphingomonadaceae]ADC31807.1 AntAa [Sphingomonas sp. XLDN2-5]MEA3541772.1 FAD-dependent oxidoreductase [Pseudomonadota bacterium]QDK35556.1 ferredoxin-NAD reductase [Sphingomonas sp. IC081]QSR20437.1 ferredoxin-NAD reductase [Novosphingobium sp. KA1]BAF03246.1 anthranilate dioxygenase reductase [Novosphingobium sp. KA1]
MTLSTQCFVIVGGGQAGAWIARTLRAEGYDGRILLIAKEIHLPYERPPLSKDILSGKTEIASAALLTADSVATHQIEVWTGTVATEIDRDARIVRCADGRSVTYDHLFLTTGSRVRTLPFTQKGEGPKRVHVLRDLDDAQGLRTAMKSSRRIGVIGGGWIGLEVAATARQMGLDVIVLEAAPRLCGRSLPEEISAYLALMHKDHGTDVRTGAAVEKVTATADGVQVDVAGEALHFDHVVIGIGIVPETDLAAAAGLAVDNGILVDECGRTLDPHISAAGDVTSHPNAFMGGHVRMESWANAQNQAIVAAKAAIGAEAVHADIPWVWSDQYDANFQIIGMPERAATLHKRGNEADGKCCWLAVDAAGKAIGAVSLNMPRELRLVRKALEQDKTPDLDQWQSDKIRITEVALLPA